MDDCQILSFDVKGLLDQKNLYELYSIEEPEERARLKALFVARAKDLKLEKEIKSMFKAYDLAEKSLADEYTRENAIGNSNIPLLFDGRGKPIDTIENFLMILRNDEKFKGIKFNLLSYSPEKHSGNKISAWEDTDDCATRNYIEKKYKLYSPTKLDDALRIIFQENSYNPVKNIIESTEWDGVERIPTLLIKWLKCEDNEYSREVSRLIFAGGINRLYNPGCKFDDVPVLIGIRQGEGKSTFVRWLALRDEFFNEVNEIDGQKGMEAIKGAWICELSELLALTKAKEVEAVKSYITRLEDVYRQPYDKRVSKFKRQCIFIGTTNKEQFLTDKTGNRRFYPVKINQTGYDLFNYEKEIKADILQCWAEALYKYRQGEMKPFADRSLVKTIRQHQAAAVEDDYRVGMIESYLIDKTRVCRLELWQKALQNEYSKPTRKDSQDLTLIMQQFDDWEMKDGIRFGGGVGKQRGWVKKDSSIDVPFSN